MDELFNDNDIVQPEQVSQASVDSQQNQSIFGQHHLSNAMLYKSTDSTSKLQNIVDQTNTSKSQMNALSTQQVVDIDLNARQQSANGRIIDATENCEEAKQDHCYEQAGEQRFFKNETIDLISDQEEEEETEATNHDVNYTKNGIENVAGPSQPLIQSRKVMNGNANVSGHKENVRKLTNTIDTKTQFQCEFCEYSTNRKQNLQLHIRKHTHERPYECTICEKRFTQSSNLNQHMKRHAGMLRFKCSKCRRVFSHEKQCKLHEICCIIKVFECYLCKKIRCSKRAVMDHMRKHTGEKFRCLKCRKWLGSKRTLTQHMKLHETLF